MANQTAEQVTENLFQAVDTIIKQRVQNLPYDQTIICTVVDDSNAEYGKYIVESNYNNLGSEDNRIKFTVYSDNPNYTNGDRVYVRIPAGDFTQQKVITGAYVSDTTGKDDALTSNDYYIAEESEETYQLQGGENSISLYDVGFFPGYGVFCLKFIPKFPTIENINYNSTQLNISCQLEVTYTVPAILNSDFFKKTFVINLRNLSPNLFRTTNKTLTYYINLENILTTPQQIQVRAIELKNLQFIGTEAANYNSASLLLDNISYSFGYYIPDNIGRFLYIFVDDKFYNPEEDEVKKVYFHYYDSSVGKYLEHIENGTFRYDFDNIDITSEIADTLQDNDGYYSVNIPVEDGRLSNNKSEYTITIYAQDDNIDLSTSISLINAKYYDLLYQGIINGQKAAKFLTGYNSESEEDGFNNGVFYIYGQDGRPTDASASHITRKAMVQFVDYVEAGEMNIEDLAVQWPVGKSMIVFDDNTQIVSEGSNRASITFKISNYYAQDKVNNTITWQYYDRANDTYYTYQQELLFGYSGSQGSDYSLILSLVRVNNGIEQEVPAVIIDDSATYKIKGTLYDYNNKEQSASITYSAAPGTQWRGMTIASNGALNNIPTSLDSVISTNGFATNCYSACAKAEISALKIEAFIPIPLTIKYTNSSTGREEKYILSGPSTITYDITGKKPFASKLPYKLSTDVSNLNIAINTTQNIPAGNSESILSCYPSLESNNLELPSAYSQIVTDQAPTVIVKLASNNQTVWVQPLYIWQNKYPNAMKNSEAKEVIIPENGTSGMKIVNTNVGRVLSDGTGLFLGDYGTATAATYGLYAFKPRTDGKVDKVFRLTANGEFQGEMTLLKNGSLAGYGNAYTPVYYKNGAPASVTGLATGLKIQNVTNTVSATTTTIQDVIGAINSLKSAISKVAQGTSVESQVQALLDTFDFQL